MFAAAKIVLLRVYSNSWYDSHFRGLSVSGVERVVFHPVVLIFRFRVRKTVFCTRSTEAL